MEILTTHYLTLSITDNISSDNIEFIRQPNTANFVASGIWLTTGVALILGDKWSKSVAKHQRLSKSIVKNLKTII